MGKPYIFSCKFSVSSLGWTIDCPFCPHAVFVYRRLAFVVSLKVNFYCPQQPISVAKVRFVIYQDVAAQWNNELPQ